MKREHTYVQHGREHTFTELSKSVAEATATGGSWTLVKADDNRYYYTNYDRHGEEIGYLDEMNFTDTEKKLAVVNLVGVELYIPIHFERQSGRCVARYSTVVERNRDEAGDYCLMIRKDGTTLIIH